MLPGQAVYQAPVQTQVPVGQNLQQDMGNQCSKWVDNNHKSRLRLPNNPNRHSTTNHASADSTTPTGTATTTATNHTSAYPTGTTTTTATNHASNL
ncbi:MAG: hypothetical protein MG2_0346 [uncultured Candidatus Poseidoniales archaeon]|nr:MAG: hypothetical protein MG2_0346 [uncultured Candidatus Poseidoniales archaeon]